jgi:ketosteroid isomerase-like protein
MPQENAEVVRVPIAGPFDRPRRRPEQHLARFPRANALFTRPAWWVYMRFPPRSAVRRAMVRRYARMAAEALNRRDLDAAFAAFHQNVESTLDPGMVALGLEPVYRGRDARIQLQARWNAEWGDWRFEPKEAIDFGDGRLLVTGHLAGSGLSSGVAVDSDCGFLVTVSGGKVIREEVFLDRQKAFEAVGLSE